MRWWSVRPASLVTSVDLSMFRDLEFSDFADTDQRAESAVCCVGVKVHPASLASPSAHERSSSLKLEAFATAAHSAGHIPGCPKGSRPLTSSASTLTLISVVFARLRQLRGVSGTDRQHVQDGVVRFHSPVPRPSDTARRVGPAVVQVAPNLTLEQCRDALKPRRAFSQQPPPGSLTSHDTFGAYPLRAFRTGQV